MKAMREVAAALCAVRARQSAHEEPAMLDEITRMIAAEVRTAEVRAIVRFCIVRKQLTDYTTLANALGMFSGGSELSQCLGRMMDEDFKEDRPLASAAVVSRRDGIPGRGFFEKARSLGLSVGRQREDEVAFWKSQVHGLGLGVTSDVMPNLTMSLARKLWLARKRAPLALGDHRGRDANDLAAEILDRRTGTRGQVLIERKSPDEVAVVRMPHGEVIAVAEDDGPVAVVIGLVDAEGEFQPIRLNGIDEPAAQSLFSSRPTFANAAPTESIRCWICETDDETPASVMRSGKHPSAQLRRTHELDDRTAEFRLLNVSTANPISDTQLERSPLEQTLHRGVVAIAASPYWWRYVDSYAEGQNGEVVLKLRRDEEPTRG